ncbi:MAG: biotin--[acetyl-CoA-carboxylase] ligase [Candidatus Sumerlaeia bacterium]
MSPQAPAAPEELNGDNILPLLKTWVLGRKVYAFGRCDSTNVVARRLMESRDGRVRPLEHGAIVLTDYQYAGKGRNARRWHAPHGTSLLFSLILDPCAEIPETSENRSRTVGEALRDKSYLATMIAAAAVVRAIRQIGGPVCAIKWPNDVLSQGGRKICGILTERLVRTDDSVGIICGIGVNVNQEDLDFPEDLQRTVTSLRMLTGREISRLELLAAILEQFEVCMSLPEDALLEVWQNLCRTIGRTVRARLSDRILVGSAVGLEKDGRLIIRTENGQTESIHSGDVEEIRAVV